MLGVHANTVRSWTDQGMLSCLRINGRGDRRYLRGELERFLVRASESAARRTLPGKSPELPASLIDRVVDVAVGGSDLRTMYHRVADLLCAAGGYRAAWAVTDDRQLLPLVGQPVTDRRLVEQARGGRGPLVGHVRSSDGGYRAAIPVRGVGDGVDVLVLEGTADTRTAEESPLLAAVGAQLEMANRVADRVAVAREQERRAQLMMAVSAEFGSQLDPPHVLSQIVDRTAELFAADHAGVFSRQPDGRLRTEISRNLTAEFCQFLEHASHFPLASLALDEQRIVWAPDSPDDPRAIELRPALVREGINTLTVAPLSYGDDPLGVLVLYHDRPHSWSEGDLELLGRLARQGATVIRNAQHYSQMSTWAAQLQSIQQLGTRLNRLHSVAEIGQSICAELNQLIDFHNVRVYRVEGDECQPIAWRGEIGEYEDENGDQLRVKVGEGITGWVARYGLAQNLGDAAGDRRSKTIPGTADDLEESLLLAPMLYEDEVIGVIVLAKLGLNQFSSDDMRLLEIYASLAAQALVSADTTGRLRAQTAALGRQVDSQRELLRVTESMLGTLDTQALLEEIAQSLNVLLRVDNICVDIHDEQSKMLTPIFARGTHAAEYLANSLPDDQGEGGYVMGTGEALLIQDELNDPRVAHFASTGPLAGSLIVAPLRSGERIQGLLTIERLGPDASFSDEEFELVKLFAAHVSVALRNAATHRAVEIKAETDQLTELWNHGALVDHIETLVAQSGRFSMLMVDLDFFKRFNDRYGHQAGNLMLQQVARVLRSSCRASDQVFRFGGDEFALLLPGTGLAGAQTVAEKVQSAIAELNDDDRSTLVTCSVGVAVYPHDGGDAGSVILAADRACYAAKRAGRNRMATATEGLALAGDFQPTQPIPPESVEPAYSVA